MTQHRWTSDQASPYQPQDYMSAENRLPYNEFHSEPFVLVYYSTSWTYHEEHGFLPLLGRINFKAGCNGVAGRRGAAPDPAGALIGATRKGGVIIHPDSAALGPWGRYIVSYPTNMGSKTGKHFCWKFDEFERVGAKGAQQSDTSDAWWAFVVYLRDQSGLIGTPPDHSISRLISVQEDRVDRISDKISNNGGNPETNSKYKAAVSKLDAMREAAAALFSRDIESKAPLSISGAEVASMADLGVDLSAVARQAAAAEVAEADTGEAAPAVKRRRSTKAPKEDT